MEYEMGIFAGIVGACLIAVGAIGKAWLKQRKDREVSVVTGGLVFTATCVSALVILAVALNGFAGSVGWQAVGAAAFVATTPLIMAMTVLTGMPRAVPVPAVAGTKCPCRRGRRR
jgi:drug/metabolite transporter (DMT)-like permease